MFAFFFSLYKAMFTGTWNNYSLPDITNNISTPMNMVVRLLTNIFNSTTDNLNSWNLDSYDYLTIVSFILALITSIGIVVLAVKGIKRVFAVFFTLGR